MTDNFKFLTKDINKLGDIKKQEYNYDRSFTKYMNNKLAYEVDDIAKSRGIYQFETPLQNLHQQPTIIRPIDYSYDGKTSYLLKDLNNRKVEVSGYLYDINDIPIFKRESTRQQ